MMLIVPIHYFDLQFQHGFSAEYEMARPVDCGFKVRMHM